MKWRQWLVLTSGLLSGLSWAHFPVMECQKQADHILCQAGYSDSSPAINETVRMFDYDDVLIEIGKTDQRSEVTFTVPNGDYYIVFDPGHEAPVEIDGVEL
ncbi:hypothetical protein [Vibrio metschnikovii]|uniref:hypothetical protein n=1 Tax=Vibrio metschnikovii TaxID=28172 RepID=UPI0013021279|nr:hypothetical protein [Vibrio metschnikovii]